MCLSRACRCVIVGSITGNRNTLAGNIPPQADLGQLQARSRPSPPSAPAQIHVLLCMSLSCTYLLDACRTCTL